MKKLLKKRQKRLQNLGLIVVAFFMMLSAVTTAWATVTYVTPDKIQQVEEVSTDAIPEKLSLSSKAKAPEPATIALFGGGFIGMIVTFLKRTYAITKRIFDICAAIIGIILTLPLILVTAFLVKLTSKGPVFYSQVRVGKDEKTFRMYKFRTMRVDAEKESGPVWASKNDHRLTPIGGFLRKMRIDELPQFVNILQGHMSLIGPRPERPLFVNELKQQVPDYEKRLSVKPGITGLAQVRHRYDETIADVKKKVKYDLFYIKKMNFWQDMGIVFRTILVVLTGFGAR